jgi:hypothetical protein
MQRWIHMRANPVRSDHDRHAKSALQVFASFFQHPVENVLRKWNWKSAVLSSALRAILFFTTNLSAGMHAALAALCTDLAFRGVSSGFYGALTEAVRDVEPPWAAAVTVMLILPLVNHSLELLVHWLRGTHNLAASILSSIALTVFSTLFNLYAMRRGVLIVGAGRRSLARDLLHIPRLIWDFLLVLPLAIARYSSLAFREQPPDER